MYLCSTISNSHELLVTPVLSNRIEKEKRINESQRNVVTTGKSKNVGEISQTPLPFSNYWNVIAKRNQIILLRID